MNILNRKSRLDAASWSPFNSTGQTCLFVSKTALLTVALLALGMVHHGFAGIQLYIAAGQSNMVGANARAEPRHLISDPRVAYHLAPSFIPNGTKPDWQPTIGVPIEDLGKAGVGPFWAFSRVMAETHRNDEIRILMIAMSGSPLNKWIKGGEYYDTNIALVREAIKQGMELKGFIWHQGESGTGILYKNGPDLRDAYANMFSNMISDYRQDLGVQFPVVAGTIDDGEKGWINEALVELKDKLPQYSVAETTHRTLGDSVHYDARTSDALGLEMGRQMLALQALPALSPSFALEKPREIAWTPPSMAQEILACGDTYTMARFPATNMGGTPQLYVGGGNDDHPNAFIRFSGLKPVFKKVTLALHARAVPGATGVILIHRVDGDFDEKTLNANNAPKLCQTPVPVEGKITVDSGIVIFDVTSLATGISSNTLAFALTSAGKEKKPRNFIIFDSREGEWAPRLIVE